MVYDCIIIGAGPAGLMAAIYLARFRRKFIIIDNKQSRATLIKKSHNYPGFLHGISGNQILSNLKGQLATYGIKIKNGTVTSARKNQRNSIFTVNTKKESFYTKKIIFATGVMDIEPALPKLKNAIKGGFVRHCPICDGYEVINQKIAVIGRGMKGINEALFLKTYTSDITYIPFDNKMTLTKQQVKLLHKNNIILLKGGIHKIEVKNNRIVSIRTQNDETCKFDTIYSALGCSTRSKIAIEMGAKATKEHFLVVNKKQETNIKGLYAIGDVAMGINQIAKAFGTGAVAAINIHDELK